MSNDDIVYLKIRSLIADKEMATAIANMNIAHNGEWLGDYPAWHAQIDQQIQALFEQLAQPQP